MTNSKLSDKTEEQLKTLKASLDDAANYCTTQQNQFWGKGQHDAADQFSKNAESFAEQSQAIQDELNSRREAQMSKEQKKAMEADIKEREEQHISDFPPSIKPADQPTPATQPYEPSTEVQQESGKKSGSSSS